jgi:arylsulfatase
MNAASSDQPNILMIVADQWRHDCAGFAGNRQIRTPHLDALAGEGRVYENCFTCFPVCTPARYSMLTGVYAHQHRGNTNHCTPLPRYRTFAEQLREGGYRTAAVGKMHFTPTYLDMGFERMRLAEQDGPGRWDDDYHRELREKGLVDGWDLMDQRREYRELAPPAYWDSFGAAPSDLPEGWDSTSWIGRQAMGELSEWQSGGNCLMVSFIKPHHPFDPPEPWFSLHDPESLELLPGWTETPSAGDLERHRGYFPHEKLSAAALRRVMGAYYGSISHIDRCVGQMIDLLRRRGLYERTVVIVTSDHGEYMGFHHLLLKQNHMYDPLMRVPLLIKPVGAAAGARDDRLCSLVHLPATICAAAGATPPATADQTDLLSSAGTARWVFAQDQNGSLMVRSRRYKLLLSGDRRHCRFFDLQADPLEHVDQFENPAMQAVLGEHREAAMNWYCFAALPPHVDPGTPRQIVHSPSEGDIAGWYDARFRAWLDRWGRGASQAD